LIEVVAVLVDESLDPTILEKYLDEYERVYRHLGDRWLEYGRASELARPTA
jgi:hypothetical protein